jgi:hypothetical protein
MSLFPRKSESINGMFAFIFPTLFWRPEIAQAMGYGDRRPHLVSLLVPDTVWVKT